MPQTTGNILLIRPCGFSYNAETAVSNAFQNVSVNINNELLNAAAVKEFDAMADVLRKKGVNVFVFDDTAVVVKPDAVFPNNWVTFHADGTVVLYPMCAPNRRFERRMDIIDSLRSNFFIKNIIDLSSYENEGTFLEGTGSIIFDHLNRIAYASISIRTNKELFFYVCESLNYKPVCFHSYDRNGKEIYHTNVMMCVGDQFAIVCTESILENERSSVIGSLEDTGHEIVHITRDQMNSFAGNMLQISNQDAKKILVLSETAFSSLTDVQRNTLAQYNELLPIPIKTIETIGGGSVRCMIAEIFLKPL